MKFQGFFKTPEPWQALVEDLLKEVQKDKPAYARVCFTSQDYPEASGNTILVAGVGGSIMGTRAVCDLLGYSQRFFFLDTLDGVTLHKALTLASQEPVTTLFISKSGTTLETLKMVACLEPALKAHQGEKVYQNTWVVTAKPEAPLGRWAKERGVSILSMPEDLSGRFSFFSSVGMLPLSLGGVPYKAILQGAQKAWEAPDLNLITPLLYNLMGHPSRPLVLFCYGSHLYGWGLWFQQLWAESLGKKVFHQIPSVALGPRDQHSILQMLLDVPATSLPFLIQGGEPQRIAFPDGKDTRALLKAFCSGVRDAFWARNIPALYLELPEMSPEETGKCLMTFMILTHLAGTYLQVATFEQPAVELAKQLTKQYLQD